MVRAIHVSSTISREDCKSRIEDLSRDRSVERSISNWSHASRSIQVDCRYAAPICLPLRLSLSFSFSLLPISPARSFLLSLSLARFSYLRPFRAAACWNLRNWRERSITPHIFVSGKYINIHSYASYAIVTCSGLELIAFSCGFFKELFSNRFSLSYAK